MLIAFSGLDGTGKSAQLDHLAASLRQRGRAVRAVRYRPGYGPVTDGARAAIRRGRPGLLPAAGEGSASRDRLFARPVISRAWLTMALIGTLWMYGLRARLHRGSTLLFDRWIDDGLIDLDLRFPDFRRRRSWLARGAERWAARPDLQVLLVAPDEVMTARRAAKDEPFPDPPERWRGRVAAYRALAPTRPDIVVIDAAGPLEDVADRVWREVAPRLGPR